MKEHRIKSNVVYLSLGDKEEKARNPIPASVGTKIREAYDILSEQGVNCTLEWNKGNHFHNACLRTTKAFVWAVKQNFKTGADDVHIG